MKTNCLGLGFNNDAGTRNFFNQRHSINANANIMRMQTPQGNNAANNRFYPVYPTRCHNNPYLINAVPANDTRWNTVTPW